jgi:hypothetical protein
LPFFISPSSRVSSACDSRKACILLDYSAMLCGRRRRKEDTPKFPLGKGEVPRYCGGNLPTSSSFNVLGLSPGRRKALISTSAGANSPHMARRPGAFQQLIRRDKQ